MAPVMMLSALSWMEIESLTGDSVLMRGRLREESAQRMAGRGGASTVTLGHFDGQFPRSRIVQLLGHFHQPRLSISQQSVAELVGIELRARVGYDVISRLDISIDHSVVTGRGFNLFDQFKSLDIDPIIVGRIGFFRQPCMRFR